MQIWAHEMVVIDGQMATNPQSSVSTNVPQYFTVLRDYDGPDTYTDAIDLVPKPDNAAVGCRIRIVNKSYYESL